MSVFLNFEPTTLLTPCPPDLLGQIRHAEDHLRVFVEFTGDLALTYPGSLFDALAQVREIGWGVSIDIAAADPHSLALLPLIHPDVIKVNLRCLGDDRTAIARLGEWARLYNEQTGAAVLACGIEESDDILLARVMGAEFGQGWYFGLPEPLLSTSSAPHAVFPLLTAPPMDVCATPFEIVKQSCPTAIAEQRFLQLLRTYLEEQIDSHGSPALLLASFDRSAIETIHVERISELADRSAFTIALGPRLPGTDGPRCRTLQIHPDDLYAREWNILVVGRHYSGALVARDVGDDGDRAFRRFEYAVTHDRELILQAARGFLRQVESATAGRRLDS